MSKYVNISKYWKPKIINEKSCGMKKEWQSKEQFNRSMRHPLTIEFKQRSEIFNLIFAQQYFKTVVKFIQSIQLLQSRPLILWLFPLTTFTLSEEILF